VTRLEIIRKALEKGDTEKLRGDLDTLYNHAQRIAQITGNLLTFSRESPSKIELVDVNDAVERVVSLINPQLRKKGIELETLPAPGLKHVRASVAGIEQVVYNIAYNAYQATERGGKIKIITRKSDDGKIEIVISDTGRGMTKEDSEHIFEPFFTTKEVGEGTGLGLSISYGHIQNFGGSINVESEPDMGTTFTISLLTDEHEKHGTDRKLIESNA